MIKSFGSFFGIIAIFASALAFLTFGPRQVSAGGELKLPTEPVKISGWEVIGPTGGDVRVVTIDPRDKDRLYVSTLDGQIHTSADGGKTWSLLANLNKPGLVLDQLSVDLRDSKSIYTSGHRHKEPGGFFLTRDGGATWKEAKELRKTSIHSMFQSKKNPDFIVVGTTDGMWKSTDSGENWNKIESKTMPDTTIDSIAIDPRDDDTIYAGTWWRAYKTTDGGKNWRLIKNGMIDDSDVFAVTLDPRDPNHVIASACSGIYESFNQGELWKKIQGIPSQSRRTRDILQHPSVAGTVFAGTTEGFWVTTNGSKSWAITTQKDLEINSIAVHPDAPNRVFLGTNNYGVLVSNDGGRNFEPTNVNYTSRFAYTITADIETPNRFYATTHNTATGGGFMFISDDGGNTWKRPKNFDVVRISPFGVVQDRVNANLMYLASNVGIYKSVDRGGSWTQITAPKPVKKAPVKKTTSKTAPKPTPGPTLIPVITEKVRVIEHTEDGKNGYLAGTDSGLYRSYDVAKGWEKVPFGSAFDPSVFAIHSSPNQPGTIWVGTEKSGVLVTRDGGKTWEQMNTIPKDAPISSIMSDPRRFENIYVGTTQTLYLTRDNGKTWTRRGGNLPLGNFTSILVNPDNTDEVFVASALEQDGGIFYSKDAGQNWKRVDSKEMKLASRRIWSMIFDPNNSGRIFAATHSSGIYRIDRAPATTAETSSRPRVTDGGN